MTILTIKLPDKVSRWDMKELESFKMFLQGMANRYYVGNLRYGQTDKKSKYQDRLAMEFLEYKKTGNYEQLLNIAVYCFLESEAPQNKAFHFDPNAASVTREEK